MREVVTLLLLLVVLVVVVKGLPVAALGLQGRRIQAAARSSSIAVLLQASGSAAGLAELCRVLRQLSTRELVRLGTEVTAEADTERGSQLLGTITGVLETRKAIAERWTRVSQPDRPAGLRRQADRL